MMVNNLPIKEIKRSLEVVVVFANHPSKIKLDNHFLGLENTVYMLFIEFLKYLLCSEYCSICREFYPTRALPAVRH